MKRRPPTSTLFPYTTLFRSRMESSASSISTWHPLRPIHSGCSPTVKTVLTDSRAPRATMRIERGLRSEEHTSELQSHVNLVCRLLLEKKKKNKKITHHYGFH